MAQFKRIFYQDLTKKRIIHHCEDVVFGGDNLSDKIGVYLYDNGEPYAGGGTVSGTVINSRGQTVPITTGDISGNLITVTLEEAALAVPGIIGVYVKLTSGQQIATVLSAMFSAMPTETDQTIDPGTIIPSVSQLITDIQTAVDSIPAEYTELLAAVAPTFSASTAYTAGSYVWQGGSLYRFTADHPAGAWTGTDAVQVSLANDLGQRVSDLRSAIDDIRTATVADTGKALTAKTIAGGKVTEWEFKEASGGETDLPDILKTALLQIAQHTIYDDGDGQNYYQDLWDALYATIAISLNYASLLFHDIGDTAQMVATTYPSGKAVTWSTSNANVASISETGLVTVTGYGTAVITATSGDAQATCDLLATQLVLESIEATYTQSGTVYTTDTLDSLKEDLVVKAIWSDSSETTLADNDYTLSGTLTAGTSTITASYGGETDTFTVNVTTMYTITNTLTGCTTSNDATTATYGSSYSATLTPNTGLVFDTVSVKMGGVDITSTAYSDGGITIASVTGNIVITATAVQDVSGYNIVGSPSIVDGILTPSEGNYITSTRESPETMPSSWELRTKIKRTSNTVYQDVLVTLDASNERIRSMQIELTGNGSDLSVFLGSGGSSWNISNGTTLKASANIDTWYWVKFGQDSTTVYLETSTDGINYSRVTITASSRPASFNKIAFGKNVSQQFTGEIDLHETALYIDGSLYWRAI